MDCFKIDMYATRNDRRLQMIHKIDLNTTRNDPQPQMIPTFFHTRPEMINVISFHSDNSSGIISGRVWKHLGVISGRV